MNSLLLVVVGLIVLALIWKAVTGMIRLLLVIGVVALIAYLVLTHLS